MTRDKNLHGKNEELKNNEANVKETVEEAVEETVKKDTVVNEESDDNSEKVDQLKAKFDEKSKQCEEYINMFQRVAAEFDNYKKRTAKEKVEIYDSALTDVVKAFLPVIDNIERAVEALDKGADSKTLQKVLT